MFVNFVLTMPNVEQSFFYDMSGQKYHFIFNHEVYQETIHFQEMGHLPRRIGTEHDVDNLKKTFVDLGFRVICHHDLKYEDIIMTLANFCQSDHSETSCVIITILTHGRGSDLMAADRPYKLTELCNILHNGNLAKKPKLIFVQACRHGHHSENTSEWYPTPPDFLIMHATVADYVSYRIPEEGSFFITAICDVIKEFTKQETENGKANQLRYSDFAIRVNHKVSAITTNSPKYDYDNKKQMSEMIVTLTKIFVFWSNIEK